MALSDEARNRIFIAHTDRTIGDEIADAINLAETVRDTVAVYHEVVGATAFEARSPGKQPVPTHYGATLGLAFTPLTHEGFRTFKLSPKFAGNANFHIHWTKSTDADESGKSVKWRISYTITDGRTQDINVAPNVIELDDTYDDAGTTTRIVHRTANSVALTGAQADYYLSILVEAVTPSGTPLAADPVLVSCDLRYDKYINK